MCDRPLDDEQKYSDWYTRGKLDYKEFAKRLWGDFYFNERTRKFVRTPVRHTPLCHRVCLLARPTMC